ncbi:MAG: glycosyltransferase family 39 protein [candidate division FCPU426 bacterium]
MELTQKPVEKIEPSGSALGIGAGLGALALGILGVLVVKGNPMGGLLLFMASGLLLALPVWSGSSKAGYLPEKPAPFASWEPWFLLAFLLAAGFARFYKLGDIPPGATGAEGEIAGRTGGLLRESYQAHVADGDINFPTLIFYTGGFFAKVMGWGPGSFRFPVAIWGLVSLAAFYMVARQITSPLSAAVAAMLYASLNQHMVWSRQFFPSMPLTLAPVLGLGLFVLGWRQGGRRWFFMAGLAVGISLHGYTPGRVVAPLFMAWFAWLFLFQRASCPGWRGFFWFWAGFLVCASPVLWWAYKNPNGYMNVVHHDNVYNGAGIFGYLKGMLTSFQPYLKMWHVVGDSNHTDGVPGVPILQPFAQLLFPIGVFFCAAIFWRPIPALLLGMLIASLMPAIMAGGFAHPTSRRCILAYPTAFLLVAVGLEQLRLRFNAKFLKIAFAVLVLAGGAWSMRDSWTQFFVRQMGDPVIKGDYGKKFYLAGQEMRQHPTARVLGGQTLMGAVATSLLFPQNNPAVSVSTQEDFFALPVQEHLLLFDAYTEGAIPYFKRCWPNATVRIYKEDPPTANMLSDPSNPLTYMFAISVPAADIAALRRLPDGRGTKVDPADGDFGERYAGRNVSLSGALVLPQPAGDLVLKCEWPGWSIHVEGKELRPGGALHAVQGPASFKLQGPVPAGASGPLPLRLEFSGHELFREGRMVDLPLDIGVHAEYMVGPMQFDSHKVVFSRWEPLTVRRYYDITEINGFFTGRWKAFYTAPASGTYVFDAPRIQCRIRVNGKTVYDNPGANKPAVRTPVQLEKGQSYPFVAEFNLEGGSPDRTIALRVQRPGDSGAVWMDPTAMRPAP